MVAKYISKCILLCQNDINPFVVSGIWHMSVALPTCKQTPSHQSRDSGRAILTSTSMVMYPSPPGLAPIPPPPTSTVYSGLTFSPQVPGGCQDGEQRQLSKHPFANLPEATSFDNSWFQHCHLHFAISYEAYHPPCDSNKKTNKKENVGLVK